MIRLVSTERAIASSRVVATGLSSACIASGVGCPTSASPVVDMIDVSVRTRAGCSMAIVCTIIPPIDAPTMWAESMPRWSSRPMPSAAMSVSRYGASHGLALRSRRGTGS